jgi:hypothetical protein
MSELVAEQVDFLIHVSRLIQFATAGGYVPSPLMSLE